MTLTAAQKSDRHWSFDENELVGSDEGLQRWIIRGLDAAGGQMSEDQIDVFISWVISAQETLGALNLLVAGRVAITIDDQRVVFSTRDS